MMDSLKNFLKNLLKEIEARGIDWKKFSIIFGSTLVVAVVGAKILKHPFKRGAQKVCNFILNDDKGALGGARIAKVKGNVVEHGSMNRRVKSVGELKANASVDIKAEINGKIKEINFTEGTFVEKGQSLIIFDNADIKAEIKQAEAVLMRAEAEFNRYEKLKVQNFASDQKYQEAKAEYAKAQGRLEELKAKLAKTEIKAPFEGSIGIAATTIGSYVQAGTKLVSLVDNSPIRVEFKVPEQYANDVGVGQNVHLILGANDKFKGTVSAVDSKLDPISHSLLVRAIIPNEEDVLKEGMFANVDLIIGEKGKVIMVDENAVDRDGNIEFVWMVENSKARRTRVVTGVREGGKVEILEGLHPGQIVVTDGQIALGSGTRVEITNLKEVEKDVLEENTQKEVKEEKGTVSAERVTSEKAVGSEEAVEADKKQGD